MEILIVLLILLSAFENSSTTATGLLYPYDSINRTTSPASDDGSSPLIPLAISLPLFGNTYHSLYVGNNGLLSFNAKIANYTPQQLPVNKSNPFLAVFWADVNNAVSGHIYYLQSTNLSLLALATSDIRNYTTDLTFTAKWVFVATWDKVPYYGSSSTKVNTFQVVLITDEESTYVLYNYADIEWTTGTYSGGNATTGLGGIPALAGLNNVNGSDFYTIPGSLTSAIINITSTSNVNLPGRWAFQVDNQIKVLKNVSVSSTTSATSTHPRTTTSTTWKTSHLTVPIDTSSISDITSTTPVDTSTLDILSTIKTNPKVSYTTYAPYFSSAITTTTTIATAYSHSISTSTMSTAPAVTKPDILNVGNDLLYPYGPKYDAASPKSNDGATGIIPLSIDVTIFGDVYTALFVNNNGLITFHVAVLEWVPQPFISISYLAVFWANIDNEVSGDVYYRQSTDPNLLSRATSDVRTYFHDLDFTAHLVFVATWHRVAYYASNTNKVNTFQEVLISDGNSTFLLYNYYDMQWPSLSANPMIYEDPVALAGFNNGKNTSYYAIPGSLTYAIVNISSTSNVNFPGRWAFRVDKVLPEFPCE